MVLSWRILRSLTWLLAPKESQLLSSIKKRLDSKSHRNWTNLECEEVPLAEPQSAWPMNKWNLLILKADIMFQKLF
ncbi:hypothetical protein AgCh_002500 [Apium graveolens]